MYETATKPHSPDTEHRAPTPVEVELISGPPPVATPRPLGMAPRVGLAVLDVMNTALSWLIINVTILVAIILYRVLNRTVVHGRWNVGISRNTLICANHRTMIDSYLIGHVTSFPTGLVMPWTLPYHPAAQENFFRNRVIGWFSRRWRCIPVRRGAHDFNALQNLIETLPKGQMLIFPEGSRSRTGDLLPGRPGTGKLIHDSRCKVVPIYVQGMSDVLPVGTAWPRLLRRIEVNIGKPVLLDDLLGLPDSRETSQAIIDRVMSHIQALKDDLELRAERRAARRALRLDRIRAIRQFLLHPVSFMRR